MHPVDVESYQEMIGTIYRTVGGALGIHVMMLVVERSVWLIRSSHPAATLITFDEEGISLEALNQAHPEEAAGVASELVLALLSTLGRLVGEQIAQQLTDQLQLFHQEA